MKVKEERHEQTNKIVAYSFYCPGCKHDHVFYTESFDTMPVWQFNGDVNRPTFSPSLLNTVAKKETNEELKRCHLFVIDGKIQYCGDCKHEFAGITVEMQEV